MARLRRRLLVLSGLGLGMVALVIPAGAPRAGAHPLGNFTVNRYARVEVSGPVVRVYYVLDEAEIPTFEDRDALVRDRAAFVRTRIDDIRTHLSLSIAGRAVTLKSAQSRLSLPAGQGGLPTLRLAIRFEGSVVRHARSSQPGGILDGRFTDGNEPARVGWREIVVTARGNARVTRSDAPSQDVSDELRHYPADLVQSPLDLHHVSFAFLPGTTTPSAEPLTTAMRAPARAGGAFADLVTRKVTPFALFGMVGLALLFGAGHALAPGHGKTVMAAYLVGTKGRPIDAVLVGVIVSTMHTASVLVLAAVLYQVNRSTPIDRLYPVLTVVSGALVLLFGSVLVIGRARRLRRTRVHEHEHEHAHRHGVPHSHDLAVDVQPLSRRGLVLLATSGGLLPSPSAVVVLIGAFVAGRAALGFGLVTAFSFGLAGTLTLIGLAFVFGGRALQQRGSSRPRLTTWLPIASAIAITAVGTVVLAQGVTRL